MDNIYQTIVENLGVEIFVSDGSGRVLFVNPASIEINELDVGNVIGRNVRDLIEDGYFEESSTLRVLKEKRPVSKIPREFKLGQKRILFVARCKIRFTCREVN